MPVPNTFANATATIPLSQLDANFATTITLGNTAIQLGNTVSTLNDMTLANVTVTSGNVTITNVTVTTANVTTANIATANVTTSQILNYGTANSVQYLNTSKALTSDANFVYTATGLGIGTSSPAVKLDVAGNAIIQNGVLTVGKDTLYDAFINTPESMYFNVDSDGNSTGNLFVWGTDRTGNSGGTEWMRLNSSGNLGLGVTPSAWSNITALQVESGSLSAGSIDTYLSSNAFYSTASPSGWKYITSTTATQFYQNASGGEFVWRTAASGTAGNAITFTQAMTLDASGNLGIGTTTLNQKLNIYGDGINYSALINFDRGGVYTAQIGTDGAGAIFGSTSNHLTRFITNNTERARITSSGEIKFRKSTGGTDTADTYTSITLGDDATYSGGLLNVKNAGNRGNKGNANGSPLARFEFNDATALFIDTSGEVRIGSTTDQGAYNLQCNGTGVWGAAAYVNGSDERIKEDIAPITSGLDIVTKLNPVTYRYKKDWSNDQNIQTGFIAQELLVAMEDKNYVNGIVLQGGSEGYYSVAYQNIIPLLTKAIQEQQAMIDEMKAEIAALKGAA